MRNQRGSTIVENLLALGLLTMVFYMVIAGSVQLFQIENGTSRGVSEYQVVSHLMETIKSDPAVFRKNFAPATTVDATFLANLPYVYRGNYFAPAHSPSVDACDYGGATACDGEIGYVIRPFETYSGVYMATIRVRRAARPGTPSVDVDYHFIINSN